MALPKIEVPTYEMTLPSRDEKIGFRPFTVKEEKILMIASESENKDEILMFSEKHKNLKTLKSSTKTRNDVIAKSQVVGVHNSKMQSQCVKKNISEEINNS